ncbi:MAG TPA: L,D-transpeptidase, partial [Caulobacteraceae bacterium]
AIPSPRLARPAGPALAIALLTLTGACSQSSAPQAQNSPAQAKVASAGPVNSAAPPTIVPPPPANAAPATTAADAALPPAGQAIDQATPSPTSAPAPTSVKSAAPYDPALVRLEVLLDRAGFSPGVIDGRQGTNLKRALGAYALAHGQAADGAPTPALWSAITAADAAPAMQSYQITAADEAGPFIGAIPKDYRALAKLSALGYTGPEQELAERFHMSPGLLEALNPGVDFARPGTTLLVAAPRAGPRPYTVARIEVDKSLGQVRVYQANGAVAAVYPATVGSTERPAPSGQFAVAAVAPHPAYFYDPARLTFTPQGASGKLRIAPGPNNPVGSTWIALTVPTYGIHGASDPSEIGKVQSHGCVRLTNWDAAELGAAVKKGVEVDFVGTEKKAGKKKA